MDKKPLFIAGPCVIESEAMALDIAHQMKEITAELGIPYIFKASYDKANRTSGKSFRGLGMEKGLEILAKVRAEVGVPVLTDVHTEAEVPAVAAVVDVLQTPAFLCRQTDFIRACAQSGKPVNIKKGQFLAPGDMANVIAKARAAAQEAGLDLVKIAPQAKPPVCKIIDYGKYRYELSRKEKEAKKKQKTIDIKEVRLSPNIDTNDLNTKVNAARKFLSKGDRVKVTLRFRGREMAHMASSKHVLDDFAEPLADVAVVEKAPKIEGRSMTMFLSEKR